MIEDIKLQRTLSKLFQLSGFVSATIFCMTFWKKYIKSLNFEKKLKEISSLALNIYFFLFRCQYQFSCIWSFINLFMIFRFSILLHTHKHIKYNYSLGLKVVKILSIACVSSWFQCRHIPVVSVTPQNWNYRNMVVFI